MFAKENNFLPYISHFLLLEEIFSLGKKLLINQCRQMQENGIIKDNNFLRKLFIAKTNTLKMAN